MDNYPVLTTSEEEQAPWNKNELYEEKQVIVCLSISKTFQISVEKDSNIYDAVNDQIYLPHEVGYIMEEDFKSINLTKYKDIIKDIQDWNVDDLEVIEE